MSYLVKKIIKGKAYFYLTANVKVAGRSKKIQLYVGPAQPAGRVLRQLNRALAVRVRNYLEGADPLLVLIRQPEVQALERVRTAYKKLLRQSPAVRERYHEWFTTTFTYNSNAIEGSTLTPHETAMVLFEGITPLGRPLRDVRAAENHRNAFEWALGFKGDINKQFILRLHKILTAGILRQVESGRLRRVQVWIRGVSELPPKPEDVEPQLRALLRWYRANKRRYHPVVVAAYFHAAFEGIHPFVDWNGRTGRLLLNFILIKNGFSPIDIRNRDRQRYYSAIRAAIAGNLLPFVIMVVKYLKDIYAKIR